MKIKEVLVYRRNDDVAPLTFIIENAHDRHHFSEMILGLMDAGDELVPPADDEDENSDVAQSYRTAREIVSGEQAFRRVVRVLDSGERVVSSYEVTPYDVLVSQLQYGVSVYRQWCEIRN